MYRRRSRIGVRDSLRSNVFRSAPKLLFQNNKSLQSQKWYPFLYETLKSRKIRIRHGSVATSLWAPPIRHGAHWISISSKSSSLVVYRFIAVTLKWNAPIFWNWKNDFGIEPRYRTRAAMKWTLPIYLFISCGRLIESEIIYWNKIGISSLEKSSRSTIRIASK